MDFDKILIIYLEYSKVRVNVKFCFRKVTKVIL